MTSRTAQLDIRRGTAGEPARREEFVVPFEDGATVLDALIWIRAHRDPSLAVRYSCINANVCKECTIRVDGGVVYACTTRLVADRVMMLDPLPGKPLLRDLVTETRPPRERLYDQGRIVSSDDNPC
jgi:succinate dehydrogenase/fumarate reductase-like Fe-S protein